MMHQLWNKELFLSNPRAGNHKEMLNVAHAQQVELPGITENVAVNRATGCFTAYHTNTKVIIKECSKQTAAKVYVATKIAKCITCKAAMYESQYAQNIYINPVSLCARIV